MDLIAFFEDMYNYNLNSLKEYVENKERIVNKNEWLGYPKALVKKEKEFTTLRY